MHSSLRKLTAVSLFLALCLSTQGLLFAEDTATQAGCTSCTVHNTQGNCKDHCADNCKDDCATNCNHSCSNQAKHDCCDCHLPQHATNSENPRLQQADVVKLSETFGHLIGRNLDNPGIKFDLESIVKGMRNAAAGANSPMTEQEYEEAIAGIQENAFNELANKNLKEANQFMANNAHEQAIVEVEPGKLQYRVMTPGQGAEIESTSTPTIRYSGAYIDGTLFGSSDEAGGPVTLPLAQTIPGFQKGLLGMKEGEKRRIYIHPDLGYGTAGHLPPNSLLVFDVEVVTANSNANDKTAAKADAKNSNGNVAETNRASKTAEQ